MGVQSEEVLVISTKENKKHRKKKRRKRKKNHTLKGCVGKLYEADLPADITPVDANIRPEYQRCYTWRESNCEGRTTLPGEDYPKFDEVSSFGSGEMARLRTNAQGELYH